MEYKQVKVDIGDIDDINKLKSKLKINPISLKKKQVVIKSDTIDIPKKYIPKISRLKITKVSKPESRTEIKTDSKELEIYTEPNPNLEYKKEIEKENIPQQPQTQPPKNIIKTSDESNINLNSLINIEQQPDEILIDTSLISKPKHTSSTHTSSKSKNKQNSATQQEQTLNVFNEDELDYRKIMLNYDYTKNQTKPKITKFELALIIGKRAKQIEEGANANVKVKPGQNAIEIAEEELRQRKIPFIIKRPIGNTFEYWKPADMEVVMD